MILCAQHWPMLPKPLRARLWRVAEAHRVMLGNLIEHPDPACVEAVQALDAWIADHVT
jgi:hypothetical protein